MEVRQRRSFTEDYKRQAAELVLSSGRSIGSVAKELGLRDSVLRRWVDKLRQACNFQFRAAGRDPAGPSRERPALWQSPGPCGPADAGTRRQPGPDRTADAPAWHPRHHGTAAPGPHHRQSSRSAGRAESDRARLHRCIPKSGLAGRHHRQCASLREIGGAYVWNALRKEEM